MRLLIIFFIIFASTLNAQTKKEQIISLQNKYDSLLYALKYERSISNDSINKLKSEVSSLDNKNKIQENKINSLLNDSEFLKKNQADLSSQIKLKNDTIALLLKQFLKTDSSNIEDYYLNEDVFKIDTTYSNVFIDGKSFEIRILSDKLNEHLEKYEKPEEGEGDVSPKTVVFYSDETGKIAYVKKFDASKPYFLKQCGNLSKEGKLYLHWMSFGGGSGFSSNTSLVSLEDGKIVLTEIFNSGEMDFVLFNKNDKEIYILKGIWDHKLDINGEPVETHFSNHKYKILQYRHGYDGFEKKEIGTTKNKYSSLDEGKSGIEILNNILKGENFMPGNTVVSEYLIFDNFNGVIIAQ